MSKSTKKVSKSAPPPATTIVQSNITTTDTKQLEQTIKVEYEQLIAEVKKAFVNQLPRLWRIGQMFDAWFDEIQQQVNIPAREHSKWNKIVKSAFGFSYTFANMCRAFYRANANTMPGNGNWYNQIIVPASVTRLGFLSKDEKAKLSPYQVVDKSTRESQKESKKSDKMNNVDSTRFDSIKEDALRLSLSDKCLLLVSLAYHIADISKSTKLSTTNMERLMRAYEYLSDILTR